MNAANALQPPATFLGRTLARLGLALTRVIRSLADLMARWRDSGIVEDVSIGTDVTPTQTERPAGAAPGTPTSDRPRTGSARGDGRQAWPSGSPRPVAQPLTEKRKPLASWRIAAIDRIRELELTVESVESNASTETVAAIRAALSSADAIASHPPGLPRRLLTVWRGSDLDRVWLAIHRAEVLQVRSTADLVENLALLDDTRERVKQRLKSDDARLVALADVGDAFPKEQSISLRPGSMRRAAVALRAAHAVSAEQHRKVRSFRNILVATSLTVLSVALAVAVVGWMFPEWINLCWVANADAAKPVCPTGGSTPSPGDVAVVEMFGIVGAAVVGAIGIRHLRGSGLPYAVPLWSILVKLPIGALTAVLALLLLQLIDSFTISSQQEIAAWAVVFGVSQEAFTRLIDRQAQLVLDRVPSSDKNEDGTTAANGLGQQSSV
ncbi:hypothetical protein [Agromyces sp. NPDC055661]